jgi:hypothetical protein
MRDVFEITMPTTDFDVIDYGHWKENADPLAAENQWGSIFPEGPLSGSIDDFHVEDITSIVAKILG